MIPIDGGGDAGRKAALEAARRAAEEAARRAAQEAARRAAELRAREARLDRLEARNAQSRFGTTPTAAPTTRTPVATYSPQALERMVQNGGVEAVPVAQGNPPPPDPVTDAQARELVALFDTAARAWEGLPPDIQTVDVQPGSDPAAMVAAWIEAGRGGIGPGDPQAYESYAWRNEQALSQLAGLLSPSQIPPNELLFSADRSGFVNAWIRPAVAALQEQHPNATFQIQAVESGALPVRDMGAFYGENTSQLVIEMRDGSTVEHYVVNPFRLLSPTPGASEVGAALSSNEQLLGSWYESMRGQLPSNIDQGTAAATLDYLTAGRYDDAVLYGVMGMPPAQQAAFVTAFGQATPAGADHPFGLLTRVSGIGPQNVFAAVDAAALDASGTVATAVNVGAVNDLRKVENFIRDNYEQVVAPTFAQYLALRGDGPRALAGADLVNEIGVAMHLPPNHVPQTDADMAALREGRWDLYEGDARGLIDTIAGQIETVAGSTPARVAVLPVTYYSDQTGLVELPLFRVAGSGGQELFVDNEGRSYTSFDAWRTENRLPPGQFTYPADGHLRPGEDGRALTVTEATPRTVDTVREWALQAGDAVALVGGFVVLVGATVGSGGALLPVTAAALATWTGARSAGNLVDRAQHGQTLSLADPEARGEWLNLGASALGVAALGSGALARALGQGGSRFAGTATSIARLTHLGAEAADALTMGDLAHRFFTDPSLTPQDRLMIVAQVGFWAGQGAVQLRSHSGRYNLDQAEWSLANAASQAAGRPVLPPESGLTPRFEAAVAAALRDLGIDAIGFRGSAPGGSFWHDVGGGTLRDPEAWKIVENFLAGQGQAPGAYVPTKPEGAFTLARPLPDGTVDLTRALALDAYLRQSELQAGLLDVFPTLQDVFVTDRSGRIIGMQGMLGGALPVVMNADLHTVSVDGREVEVPVGPVGITVSDFDIAYVIRDGRMLTPEEVRQQLIPVINSYYSQAGYDVVNHPDHFAGMLDNYLNDRYDLSRDEYWHGPVYSFDASGYAGQGELGPTVRDLFGLPPDWHGGPPPPDWGRGPRPE